jgi:hypothetical protein
MIELIEVAGISCQKRNFVYMLIEVCIYVKLLPFVKFEE